MGNNPLSCKYYEHNPALLCIITTPWAFGANLHIHYKRPLFKTKTGSFQFEVIIEGLYIVSNHVGPNEKLGLDGCLCNTVFIIGTPTEWRAGWRAGYTSSWSRLN